MMTAADYLLTIMATLALMGNVLVLRSAIREAFLLEAIRRIGCAGAGIMTIRWWYLLWLHESLNINVVAVMGMTLVFTSMAFEAYYRLFGAELDAYFETKNLFGSQRK